MSLIRMRQLLGHPAEFGYGVRRINIDAGLRLASTGTISRFGTAGQADSIEAVSLEEMSRRYASGAQTQKAS